MKSITLLCTSEEKRRELSLLLGEAGFLAYAASGVPEAGEIIRDRRPRLVLAVEEDSARFDGMISEIRTLFPAIPLIAVLQSRDANRAVSLMRAGVEEVLALPVSKESLRACLNRASRLPGTSLSLLPPASLRGIYFYVFFVLAFLGVALGGLGIKRHEAAKRAAMLAQKNSWPLPYFYPSALAFDGAGFWVADWFSQSLYFHLKTNLAVERVVHFPNEMPVAIATTPDTVWTVSSSGEIIRRLKDKTLSAVERYKNAPGTSAIAYDGLYLWTYDSLSKRIHKRLTDSHLTEIASYPYPGAQATALLFDGKTLWSLDGPDREIIRHNINRPDEALSRTPLPEYADGKYKPTGLGFDGVNFWTVAQSLPPGRALAKLLRHKRPKSSP